MSINTRRAPVNLATGSIELVIQLPELLKLHYYNLYANKKGAANYDAGLGINWASPDFAKLVDKGDTVKIHFAPGRKGRSFSFQRTANGFSAPSNGRGTLSEVDGNFRLTHRKGHATIFSGSSGRIIQTIAIDGTVTDYLRDESNQLLEIRSQHNDGGKTIIESRKFEYLTDTDPNQGNLSRVTLRRAQFDVAGVAEEAVVSDDDFVNLKRIQLAYYSSDLAGSGTIGDLKYVTEETFVDTGNVDHQWQDQQTQYFRYYTAGEPDGFVHGLKYAFSASEFSALQQVLDPDTAVDEDIASFAGKYFEYDDQHRITTVHQDGGRLTNQMAYFVNPSPGTDRYNHWYRKAVYTQDDGGTKTVYSNRAGRDILIEDQTTDGGRWITYHRFNQQGRRIEKVSPDAIDMSSAPFTEAVADLDVKIKPNSGMIEVTTWDTVSKQRQFTQVKQGTDGTPINLTKTQYEARTVGSGANLRTVHVTSSKTTYRSAAGDGDPEVVNYTYQWYPDSVQPRQITTHLPGVPESQNGDGSPATTVEQYDTMGRIVRRTDERGTVTEYQYDSATNALIRMIEDVGGLNLTTDYVVDHRGRKVESIGPAHDVDGVSTRTVQWTVYKSEFETWNARGCRTATGDTLVNPVTISRQSADGQTLDSIQAARGSNNQSAGKLSANDTFPQTTWVRLSQTRFDLNGRQIESRTYHQIPASGEGFVDVNYSRTRTGYSSMARQHCTVAESGTITRTVYNLHGQIESTWAGTNDNGATDSDPTGNQAAGNDMVQLTANEYDFGQTGAAGNLTSTVQLSGSAQSADRVTSFLYDWRNRQIETRNEASSVHDIVTRQTPDNQGRSRFTENLSWNRHTGLSTLFAKTESLYDNRGRLYRSIAHGVDQATGTLTGETITQDSYFDSGGNLVKQTDHNGSNPVEFEFDALGRLISQTNALGHRTETVYNRAGNVISFTNPLGQVTTTRFDALGRTIQTINAMNQASGVPEFGIDGQISAQLDPLGNRTEFQTDDAGRQIAVIDAAGNQSNTVYDSAGRVAKTIDPSGHETLFEYDFLGRQTKVTDPMLDSTQQFYDRIGNVILSLDATGRQTLSHYDRLGRLVKTTDRLGYQASYEFDLAGRQSAIMDAQGGVTRYGFDSFGRLSSTQYPDHVNGAAVGDPGYGIVSLEYDSQGRLKHRQDQKGNTVTYVYDSIGRLLSREYRTLTSGATGPIADSDTFTYDANGQMLTATSGRYSNTVTFAYDAAGRSVEETLLVGSAGVSYVTQKSYDVAARLTQVIYPDGSLVERDYDSRSLIAEVRFNGQVIDTRSYNTRGQLQKSVYRNGVVTDFQYRADGLVAQIATTHSGSQQIGAYDYTYDANKNKMSESISGAGVMDDFGFGQDPTVYDAENRLTNWNRSDGNQDQAWNLSPVGNWKQFRQNAGVVDYNHSVAHELTSVNAAQVEYDANGNRLNSPTGEVYWWDADNRLVGADDHAFEYDALGRRVVLSKAESTEVLICLEQQLIATYGLNSPPNSPNRTFVYGSYIDEPVMMLANGGQYFFSRNQQYSVTALTNSAGSVAERYAYDAYGNTLVLSPAGTPRSTSALGNPFTYTGRYNHAEIGLMYFRARYYDTETGEFISRDPLEYVDGMSPYRGYFVPGGMDPSGKYTLADAEAVLIRRHGIPPRGTWFPRSLIFAEWVALEARIAGWWRNLPKCPASIRKCNEEWQKLDGFAPGSNWIPLGPLWNDPSDPFPQEKALHPNAFGQTFDKSLRTSDALPSPHRNQCTFSESSANHFLLNRISPTSGTVDLKDSFAAGHVAHDVTPISAASILDGGNHSVVDWLVGTPILARPGRHMNQYFQLRPLW